MKLKLIASASLAIALIAGAITVIALRQPSQTLATSLAEAKSTRSNHEPSCRKDNTKQFKLSSATQQSVNMAVVGQLIDVPAGTNVDVHLTTYSPTKITGTEIYGSNYGRYNFAATKTDNTADWHVTELTVCK